jgi:hypothetical protein
MTYWHEHVHMVNMENYDITVMTPVEKHRHVYPFASSGPSCIVMIQIYKIVIFVQSSTLYLYSIVFMYCSIDTT